MNSDQPKTARRVRRKWLRFATCGLLVAVLMVAAFFAGRLSMLPRAEEAECELEILRDPDAAAEKAKEAIVQLVRNTKPFITLKSADQIAEMPLRRWGDDNVYVCGPIWIRLDDRTYSVHVGYKDEPWNYFGRFEIQNGQWKAVPTELQRLYVERPRPGDNKPMNNAGESPSTIPPERTGH